jgi:hypothetical protein
MCYVRIPSGGLPMGREADLPAHPLTPNDNTPTARANHRKKQRFVIIRRSRCESCVAARRQNRLLERRVMSPPST